MTAIPLILTVQAPIVLQATQSGLAVGPKGDDGDPGPNEITTDTDTDISGILVGDTGKVRVAEPGDMPEDATHRTVTDAEKLAWNTSIGLTLGETSTTAYRGDRGKTAYDHSQATHAPSDSVSLSTVKADTDIADAISKKHSSGSDAETASSIAAIINGVSEDTLADADTFPWYKATGGLLKKITWANIKSVFSLAGHNHSGTYQPTGSYEVTTNKETSALDTSVTKYPNNAVVKSAVDGKVDKVTGSSLVADTEISKIHASGSDAETISTVGTILNGATADTLLDADAFNFWDAVDSILKKITWANIIVTIRTALFSTTSGILKANGSGVISAAAAGDMPESASYRTVTDTEKGTWNGKQAALTFGIANTNKVQIDSADVADNEYARFTASGLEGRTPAEVASDIGAATESFAIAMAIGLS
jgi:hypothetical protein